MILPREYAILYLRLSRAAERDDVAELHILHQGNPNLLHLGALFGGENPLHTACKWGSLQFVSEVLKLSPGLARRRNNEGLSPMHFASANGYIQIVKVLAEFDSGLCLVEDLDCKIPLHIAVMKGKGDVVKVLVSSCPESLQRVTCLKKTVLHLALESHHSRMFVFLLEEIKKYDLEELLGRQDIEGNTVLHIAIFQKKIEIVELLLSLHSKHGTVLVDVNSTNTRGYTPLDVHYETSNDMLAKEIGFLLHGAGALESRFLNSPSSTHVGPLNSSSSSIHARSPTQQPEHMPVKIRNLLLVVLVLIASSAYTYSNSPDDFKPQAEKINFPDSVTFSWLVLCPNPYRDLFCHMMLNIAMFLASMCTTLVLIWPLPYRSVLTFVLVTYLICYVLEVYKVMPRFSVDLGFFSITSILLVWLAGLFFMFCGVFVWLVARVVQGALKIRQVAMTSATSRTIRMV